LKSWWGRDAPDTDTAEHDNGDVKILLNFGRCRGVVLIDGITLMVSLPTPTLAKIPFLPSYLQLFRNGIIESVDARAINTYEEGQLTISGKAWEEGLLKALKQYFDIQAHIGTTPPIVIMLSLLDVKGAIMEVSRPFHPERVDRDHLLVPEVMADTFSVEPGQLLKPAFDVAWNACGYPRSLSYGDDGKRKAGQ
jgi:hypothetical protein